MLAHGFRWFFLLALAHASCDSFLAFVPIAKCIAGDTKEPVVNSKFWQGDRGPEHEGGSVTVIRENGAEETFDRTGRPYEGYSSALLRNISGKTVLEVGCGAGTLVYQMNGELPIDPAAPKPAQFIGVDIALSDTQKAKPFFKEADMLRLPFPDESFDVVISHWSLFSYPGPEETRMKALRELARVTKKEGHVRLGDAHFPRSDIQKPVQGLQLASYDKRGHGNFLDYQKTERNIKPEDLGARNYILCRDVLGVLGLNKQEPPRRP